MFSRARACFELSLFALCSLFVFGFVVDPRTLSKFRNVLRRPAKFSSGQNVPALGQHELIFDLYIGRQVAVMAEEKGTIHIEPIWRHTFKAEHRMG